MPSMLNSMLKTGLKTRDETNVYDAYSSIFLRVWVVNVFIKSMTEMCRAFYVTGNH